MELAGFFFLEIHEKHIVFLKVQKKDAGFHVAHWYAKPPLIKKNCYT
jgi:hypothetical protein